MATEISVRVVGPVGRDRASALGRALDVFRDVEAACTRFDDASPLMRANHRPDAWHRVPASCFDALEEAWRAYQATAGRFDPRVLSDLIALGYDRSFALTDGGVVAGLVAPRRRLARPPWRPRFRRPGREVHLGGIPVDLGGVGKGLAIRWASDVLRAESPDHVVNAGGDCYCAGRAPDGTPWLVGVEDPAGGGEPLAVLALSDRASATSSVRVRRWSAAGVPVHHLIDPRSGLPGGDGLAAVTVVGPDPAEAEVWSKVLFLAGRGGIAAEAGRRTLAACWVTVDGTVGVSPALAPFLTWRRP